MKKEMKHLLMMLMIVFGLGFVASCGDDDPADQTPPLAEVTVEDVEVGTLTATVKVTPSQEACPWYCNIYPADKAAEKTDEQLVSEMVGDSSNKTMLGTQNVTWSTLAAGTKYTVVAFGYNGKEASTVVRHELTTEEEKPQQLASSYFDVDYWGDVYNNGFENFVVYFGDAPHDGVNIKGMGTIYTLSIYNKTPADKSNPMPQEGEYTMISEEATEPVDFCIEPNESRRFIVTEFNQEDGTYKLADAQLLSAKATIKKNTDGTWMLDVVITDPEGAKKEFTYSGAVNLKDRSFKGYEGPVVTEDVDFEADYCPGYNYTGTQFEIMTGGDPNADDASWFNRQRLTIYLNADKDEEGNNVPPVGTFTVSNVEAPGYVLRGDYVNLGSGADGPEGTYYFFWDKKTFKQYHAFVQKGSVTISQDATNKKIYTVKCDFTTEQGISLKASYTGTLPTTFGSASAAPRRNVAGRLPRK